VAAGVSANGGIHIPDLGEEGASPELGMADESRKFHAQFRENAKNSMPSSGNWLDWPHDRRSARV
jgi:hypothetical protein